MGFTLRTFFTFTNRIFLKYKQPSKLKAYDQTKRKYQ